MKTTKRAARLAVRIGILALAAGALGCAARETASSSLREYGLPERPPAIDLTGEWRGEITWRSGGLGTLVGVVFRQEGNRVTGQVVQFPRPEVLGPVTGAISGDQVELRGRTRASLVVVGENELRGEMIGAPLFLRRVPQR